MTDTYKQFAVRTENIAAFRNTVMSYTGNPELKASTARSSADQKVYRAYDILRNLPDGIRNAKIVLTPRKTPQKARRSQSLTALRQLNPAERPNPATHPRKRLYADAPISIPASTALMR